MDTPTLMHIGNSPPTPFLSGLKRLSEGDFQGVHAEAIDMIHRDVDDSVPYCLLGVIAAEHDNHTKAVELLERATQLAPHEGRYFTYLARSLVSLNKQADARAAADQAARLPIDDAWFADAIGVVYSRTGFHEKAVPLFERAVALNPAPANFHYNLGASLQFSGAFEKAKQAYRAAIDREPGLYRAYSSLVMLQKQTVDDNQLDQLVELFEAHKTNADAALHFGHAIAKTLEDMERFEESLDWLHKAKAEKATALNVDIEVDLANFRAARQTYPDPRAAPPPDEGPSPIFIIGLPRTGTTLVDRILSSHPDVVSAGELNTFAGLIKSGAQTHSNLVLDKNTLNKATALNLAGIGKSYIEATQELARGAARMTDKMPLNFFYAGLIHAALPNARIVALRRGAMDSCLSNYRQLFSTGFSYYNYTFDLENTAKYYRAFDDLIAHWRNVLPPSRFMEISYEDIVLDQEVQTRDLLAFCGLSWDEACLRFHENLAPVSTASSVQVRQPLYSGSIGRWKKYGSRLASLKDALGPLAK